MLYVIFFLFSFYFLVLIVLIRGWRKALALKHTVSNHDQFITVLVPARNEESNIANLIADLKKQNYYNFEVFVIDDHSEDSTREKVALSIERLPNFVLLDNPGTGKKQALNFGIQKARGELIVTTDADSRVDVAWLSGINAGFRNSDTKMIFGAVRLQPSNSFFSHLQAIEFLSIIGTGVAANALGQPLFCNGANLAFRRDAFLQVGGYDGNMHIASGDDEFLLRKISAAYPGGILFNNAPSAVVTTKTVDGLKSFFQQRIRWAGKWKVKSPGFTRAAAAATFVIHVFFLITFGLMLLGQYLPVLLVLFLVKFLLEFIFLFRVSADLNVKWKMLAFIALQFCYSIYVVFIGLFATMLRYTWKGRSSTTTPT